VQAAMIIAKRFPRDQKAAMDRILMSCMRETLAEDALYEYARGGKQITGPSIRLAEELARGWGNILCGVSELTRSGGQSEVLTYAWDLETGYRDEKRFTVRHWRDTQQGGHAVSGERDIYEVIANMGARRKRACILAIIPIDVQEAAVKQCELTLTTKADTSAENIQKMLDGFAAFDITKGQIEKRIQRHLESITPALLVSLRKIYASLKDGMSAPGDWFEILVAERKDSAAATTATDQVKNKLRGKRGVVLPHYSVETAIAELKKAQTIVTLGETWDAITADYLGTNRELPVDIEAAYNDRVETLSPT